MACRAMPTRAVNCSTHLESCLFQSSLLLELGFVQLLLPATADACL